MKSDRIDAMRPACPIAVLCRMFALGGSRDDAWRRHSEAPRAFSNDSQQV